MTTITIYPLFSNSVIIPNMILYAQNNSLTVIKTQDITIDKNNGQISCVIGVSQTLTSGQQTAITNIFQGTAYIIFT